MDGASPDISVVIPVHDEAESVVELLDRVEAALASGGAVATRFEVIFVDDGSSDATREVLRGLASERPRVRVIGFRRNYGKSHALVAGFRRAKGRRIVTLDGDLQDDPAEIPRLLARLDDGFDLVGGWRRTRRDSRFKVLLSRGFNALVRWLCGLPARDINCGLKAMRREVVDEVALASGYHRFLPLLAHWQGFRVTEEPVVHHRRRHGRSRYGRGRVWRALMDLVVLLFLERLEGRPGRLLCALGAGLLAAGASISLYLAALRVATGSIQSRFPLLGLGLVLLVLGVQFVGMGLFAELLAYHLRTRHPVEPVVWEDGAGRSELEAGADREP